MPLWIQAKNPCFVQSDDENECSWDNSEKYTAQEYILFPWLLSSSWFSFFLVILVIHITAMILSRHVFAFLLIPLIKMTQYFQFTANEGLFS